MVMLGVCGFAIKNYEMQFCVCLLALCVGMLVWRGGRFFATTVFKFKLVTFKKFEFVNGHVTVLSFSEIKAFYSYVYDEKLELR